MVIGLVLLAGPGSSSAQESSPSPSPEELWNAYPLDPGGTTLAVEQGSPPAEASSARSPAPSGPDDDSGFPAWLVIALVTATAFGAGLALGRGRRRETESAMAVGAEPPGEPPSPAAPERPFVRREYPPPARPAPPPPPPTRATATTVAAPPMAAANRSVPVGRGRATAGGRAVPKAPPGRGGRK